MRPSPGRAGVVSRVISRVVRTVVAVVALTPASAGAQDALAWPVVREADLPPFLALLQARLDAAEAGEAHAAAKLATARELTDGARDPLDLMARAGGAPRVPDGAAYDAACSRAYLRDMLGDEPVVVFTFGVPADENVQARLDFEAMRIPEPPALVETPAVERTRAILRRAHAFYDAAGWTRAQGEGVFHDPSGALEVRVQDGVDLVMARYDACAAMPSGPLVVVTLRPLARERYHAAPAGPRAATTSESLTEDDFVRLLTALHTAWSDWVDAAELDELTTAAREGGLPEEMVQMVTARQANRAVFARHAARLIPLLERAAGSGG